MQTSGTIVALLQIDGTTNIDVSLIPMVTLVYVFTVIADTENIKHKDLTIVSISKNVLYDNTQQALIHFEQSFSLFRRLNEDF